MKTIPLILIIIMLISCGPSNYFDKEYYEKTTKIKFPTDYKVVAYEDNGEFLTITILNLNKIDCNKFISDNDFHQIDTGLSTTIIKPLQLSLSGLYLVDSSLRKLSENNLLVKQKEYKNGTGWLCYIDTNTCRLYCQINYPDKEGI